MNLTEPVKDYLRSYATLLGTKDKDKMVVLINNASDLYAQAL